MMPGVDSSQSLTQTTLESKIAETEQTTPDVEINTNISGELVDCNSELNQTSLFNSMFPPHLVLEIFKLVKEAQDTTDFSSLPVPYVLGSVCRAWREAVRSDTRLWDTIVIRLSPTKFAVQEQLLQDWLIRSGQYWPLYWYITFTNNDSKWKPPLSFAKLILKTSSRWRVFECSPNIPSLSQELQTPGLDFSSLVKLKIYHSPCFKLDFSGASRLQHLVITNQKMLQVTLSVNWKQLTCLEISEMIDMNPALEIVQMLMGIKNLSLSLGHLSPSSPNVRIPGLGPPPRALPSLSHLTLHTLTQPSLISVFLDAITSPALTQVTLLYGDQRFQCKCFMDEGIGEAFDDFFRRSVFILERCTISTGRDGFNSRGNIVQSLIAGKIAILTGLSNTYDYDVTNNYHTIDMCK